MNPVGKIRLAVIGIGNRAQKYMKYLLQHPEDACITYLVEPNPVRLHQAQDLMHVEADHCFRETEMFLMERHEDVDAVIIASPDDRHFDQCMRCIRHGYHVLLEKPIATTVQQCHTLAEAAAEAGVLVNVCYVLRYHPMCQKVRQLVREGQLGRIMSINYTNSIGLDRTLHTYVRGFWSRKETSCPVVLAKCCHDVDYLLWLCGSPVKSVSASGKLTWFKQENAPEGSATRCIHCSIEKDCPFSAIDMYQRRRVWISNFPIPQGQTLDQVLQTEMVQGRFGRCVYHCHNDVSDHKVMWMELEDESTICMTMDFFTHKDGRRFFIQCAMGEIEVMYDQVHVHYFNHRPDEHYDFSRVLTSPLHGNADMYIMRNFIAAIQGKEPLVAPISEALESHLICFEAED